jgi:hypothetical protein
MFSWIAWPRFEKGTVSAFTSGTDCHSYLKSHQLLFLPEPLEIDTEELTVCIAENRIGSALLERFRKPQIAGDEIT